jgi:hypothetical protein
MMQQTLFDPAPRPPAEPHAPYVAGSETSKQAAAAIGPRLSELQRQVLHYVRGQGERGATDEEIQLVTGMRPDTARARRCELRDKGLLIDSGKRRSTTSGRAAVVWVVKDQDEPFYEE